MPGLQRKWSATQTFQSLYPKVPYSIVDTLCVEDFTLRFCSEINVRDLDHPDLYSFSAMAPLEDWRVQLNGQEDVSRKRQRVMKVSLQQWPLFEFYHHVS